jgi:hypothetical protein
LTSSFVSSDPARLNSQLQEEKVKELFTGSSGEEYFSLLLILINWTHKNVSEALPSPWMGLKSALP